MAPTLKTKYREAVVPKLIDSQGYSNKMQVPALKKIVLNLCVSLANDRDTLTALAEDLGKITGQKAIITKAKKSVSNFKLREGRAIGVKVTLRGERMWALLDRFVNIALPRMRDFRGVSPDTFDGRGNYTVGLREQIIFPEIQYDKIDKVRGMELTVVTTAQSDEEGRRLLKLLGMPFRDN